MHLGAHSVDVGRLYATQRILGVLSVLWAIPAGLFLFLGMNRRMASPAWQPILEYTATMTRVPHDHAYTVIGGILMVGGVLGLIGLLLTARWVSLLSAGICATWCATISGFLGMSNVAVQDGGNFLSLVMILATAVYVVRFVLLVRKPEPSAAVQLYERG
jgi:hypothetical protein